MRVKDLLQAFTFERREESENEIVRVIHATLNALYSVCTLKQVFHCLFSDMAVRR